MLHILPKKVRNEQREKTLFMSENDQSGHQCRTLANSDQRQKIIMVFLAAQCSKLKVYQIQVIIVLARQKIDFMHKIMKH